MIPFRHASSWIDLFASKLNHSTAVSKLQFTAFMVYALATPAVSATPPARTEAAVVVDFRIGEWPDRTRLVIETDRPVEVTQNVGEASAHVAFTLNLLGIGPDALYAGVKAKLRQHPLVESFHLSGRGISSHLTLQLTELAHIKTFELPAEDGESYRVVIDIFPKSKSLARLIDARVGIWPDRERLVLETDRHVPVRAETGAIGKTFAIRLKKIDSEEIIYAINNAIRVDGSILKKAESFTEKHGEHTYTQLQLSAAQRVKLRTFDLEPEGNFGHRLVIDFMTPQSQTNARPDDQAPNSKKNKDSSIRPITRYPVEMWLEVRINRQKQTSTILALRDKQDGILISGHDLKSWGISTAKAKARKHLGEPFYRLSELGITANTDMTQLTTELDVPADLFKRANLNARYGNPPHLTTSPLGGFFNYDLTATYNNVDNVDSGGLFEVGAFNGWGSGTTSAIARNQDQHDEFGLIRLDTTWRKDDPQDINTLTLGDTATHGTAWSGGTRFAGIQWGTNFDIRPDLITLPLMTMSGEATLPSTVDLYVNDALRFREDLPPGPFTIDEIPTVTGSGETRLVVRDILGREQVITQNYYTSDKLLREGLQQYSFEIGAIREDYGIRSNAYGRPLATATWRAGLTNRLTVEGHAQALGRDQDAEQYMGGVGIAWLAPFGGTFSSAVAASGGNGNDYDGTLASAGYQYRGAQFGMGIEAEEASEHFSRIGTQNTSYRPKQRLTGYLGRVLDSFGSLALGYTEQTYWGRNAVKFGTASYTLSLGQAGQFALSAIHFLDDDSTTLQAAYTLPLAAMGTSASAIVSASETDTNSSAIIQRSLPPGSGFGYGLRAEQGDNERYQGHLTYQNEFGTWQIEGTRLEEANYIRGNASGGLALMDTGVYASRHLDRSFGVVRLDGFDDVRIYADNQEVARTDKNGYALVPNLRPYERNTVRIEQADLPLDTTISKLDLQVSPYYRSGVLMDFPVYRSRDALITVVDESGSPLPVGAVIIAASGERFPVGYHGEAFLTELDADNHLVAIWKERKCQFDLHVPESLDPLTDLGKVECTQP